LGSAKDVRVSILIPSKDRRRYLAESLRSAQLQTHPDLEILVSDDGSSDGSADEVRRIARSDRRVQLTPPNPRPGALTNIGHLIGHASGEAVAVLGDDDLLEPEFVSRLAIGLSDPSVGAAFCRHDIIDRDGRRQARRTARVLRLHRYEHTEPGRLDDGVLSALFGQMWLGSCLFRTPVIRSHPFDPNSGSASDWDLAIRVATSHPVYFVPDILWHYRDHAASLTRLRDLERRRDAVAVLEKHRFEDPRIEAIRRSLLRQRLSGLAWALATVDSAAVEPVIAAYRAAGGRRRSARYVGPLLLARLPRSLARSVRHTVGRILEA
jgi:glycosyltransferase involved in cell wall biosynthesis